MVNIIINVVLWAHFPPSLSGLVNQILKKYTRSQK